MGSVYTFSEQAKCDGLGGMCESSTREKNLKCLMYNIFIKNCRLRWICVYCLVLCVFSLDAFNV
jgi:hypothetical protein